MLSKQVAIAAKFGSQRREELLYLPTKTCFPLEEHAQTVLTPFAFSALQHEIVLSMHYAITEMANGSYLVRHYKKMERPKESVLSFGFLMMSKSIVLVKNLNILAYCADIASGC